MELNNTNKEAKVDDPNYCKYPWVISHPVGYFVLKELILKLSHEKKIELDIDEITQTNHVVVEMTSSVLPSTKLYDQRKSLIQFETFKPIIDRFKQKIVITDSQNKEEPVEDDSKGWIDVTREKEDNQIPSKKSLHSIKSMQK